MHVHECLGLLGKNIKGALSKNSRNLMNMRNVRQRLVLMSVSFHAKEGLTRYAKHW